MDVLLNSCSIISSLSRDTSDIEFILNPPRISAKRLIVQVMGHINKEEWKTILVSALSQRPELIFLSHSYTDNNLKCTRCLLSLEYAHTSKSIGCTEVLRYNKDDPRVWIHHIKTYKNPNNKNWLRACSLMAYEDQECESEMADSNVLDVEYVTTITELDNLELEELLEYNYSSSSETINYELLLRSRIKRKIMNCRSTTISWYENALVDVLYKKYKLLILEIPDTDFDRYLLSMIALSDEDKLDAVYTKISSSDRIMTLPEYNWTRKYLVIRGSDYDLAYCHEELLSLEVDHIIVLVDLQVDRDYGLGPIQYIATIDSSRYAMAMDCPICRTTD